MLKKKNNQNIIEWIEFDSSTGDFLSKWKNERNNSSQIQLIKADGNNETVWIIEDNDHLIINQNDTVAIEIKQSIYPYKSSNNLNIYYTKQSQNQSERITDHLSSAD